MKSKNLVSVLLPAIVCTSLAFAQEYRTPNALSPESIGYDAKEGVFYVGSFGDGAIAKLKIAGANESTLWTFKEPKADGRASTVGVKVDTANRRLWTVDGAGGTIYVYDLNGEKPVKKILRADAFAPGKVPAGNSFLNDLAIDSAGNAYVSDSNSPFIYKVTAAKDDYKISVLANDLTKTGFADGFNFNGIVLTRDEKALLVAKTNDGTLWRVSLEDSAVEQVKLSQPVTNADGLTWGDGNRLYVIQNFVNKISAIEYARSETALAVKELPIQEGLSVPTGAAYVDGSLIIANSQFNVTPPAPFGVFKIFVKDL